MRPAILALAVLALAVLALAVLTGSWQRSPPARRRC